MFTLFIFNGIFLNCCLYFIAWLIGCVSTSRVVKVKDSYHAFISYL